MTGNSGRPPGYAKTGGSKKGSVHTSSKAVKDAIKEVFFDDLGGKKYLRKIAKNNEALFVSLLARLIPSEIRTELNIHHHTLDLGQAMQDAEQRLALAYSAPTSAPFTDAPFTDAQIINHTPIPTTANGTDNV